MFNWLFGSKPVDEEDKDETFENVDVVDVTVKDNGRLVYNMNKRKKKKRKQQNKRVDMPNVSPTVLSRRTYHRHTHVKQPRNRGCTH